VNSLLAIHSFGSFYFFACERMSVAFWSKEIKVGATINGQPPGMLILSLHTDSSPFFSTL
jgi:hypothetical protein